MVTKLVEKWLSNGAGAIVCGVASIFLVSTSPLSEAFHFQDDGFDYSTFPDEVPPLYPDKEDEPFDPAQFIPLTGDSTDQFIDVRGVGDSGMAGNFSQPLPPGSTLRGRPSDFGQRLDAFDPTGAAYRGDLNYLNWESGVMTACRQFRPSGENVFAFVSHPEQIKRAYEQGFNLVGLANNHSRDCLLGDDGNPGALTTANQMTRLAGAANPAWLWHGVGTRKTPVERTFAIHEREVLVAFASLYVGSGGCRNLVCVDDADRLLAAFQTSSADLKILAMHSWNSATQRRLEQIGERFLKEGGDVVFGSGPHYALPVRVVQGENGHQGVLFSSLGNFLHPSLRPRRDHMIGRALFDPETFDLVQVQILPINVSRLDADFNSVDPMRYATGSAWKRTVPEPVMAPMAYLPVTE
jgi:poly-gamma-glutamate synthesis protein (capsule biosynthesis protein)